MKFDMAPPGNPEYPNNFESLAHSRVERVTRVFDARKRAHGSPITAEQKLPDLLAQFAGHLSAFILSCPPTPGDSREQIGRTYAIERGLKLGWALGKCIALNPQSCDVSANDLDACYNSKSALYDLAIEAPERYLDNRPIIGRFIDRYALLLGDTEQEKADAARAATVSLLLVDRHGLERHGDLILQNFEQEFADFTGGLNHKSTE